MHEIVAPIQGVVVRCVVAQGDTVNVTCHYDTRSRSTPVTWGNGTQDEMCLSFFYITYK